MKKELNVFNFQERFKNVIMLGNGHIPAFLYCSDPPVLFDPGVSAFGPYYLKKIKEHVPNAAALILALTHSHFDHCGAAPYLLKKISGTRVAASRRAAGIFKRPNAIALIRRLNAEYEKESAKELGNEDVFFEGLSVDLELQNGDKLELGNGNYFKIIETPGHTRDCLSYFSPDSGVLVAGEAVGVIEEGFIHSPYLVSYEDYIRSLEKLRALKPEALCVAHNGILTGKDIPLFLVKSLKAAAAYKDMIAKYLLGYKGAQEKVVSRIMAEEYDSQPEHIQKREPFLLNLTAKVNAVARFVEKGSA